MTNEKVRTVLFDFLAFVAKKSATASSPLVLYLLIKLSNLLWLLLLLVLVILFGMDVEEIEGVTIYKQQIHEIIVYYTFLVCLVTIFTVKNKVQYSFE